MPTDENSFFRESTFRICGSLEIEKALWDCFMYIRDYIPADIMLIDVYDTEAGIGETIAKADLSGGKLTSVKTVAPADTKQLIEEMRKNPQTMTSVSVADRIGDHPIMGPMSELIGPPDASCMGFVSNPEWYFIAGIFVSNNRGKKYSAKHMRLFTLLNKPFTIALSNYLRYREVLRLKESLADDNRYLQEELRQQSGEEIIGTHFGLKHVMEMVGQVAPLASPVLLLGETGTGKEVIATAIHNLSLRRNGPFIKVNCGAVPETLMDSELFGHEKGAFTGAIFQKRGRFERAQGGTIFLDEIGELTPGAQIRLLRVIQEKEIERVGGTETIKVDIRVIAATHRNLEAMLAEGKFREDLYFRLRVFPIVIPPLRDRRNDIPALVQYFMMKKSQEMGFMNVPTLAQGAIEKLINYNWPGNVRELQNAVERALILSREKPLAFDNLGNIMTRTNVMISESNGENPLSFEETMSQAIINALNITGGRVDGKKGAAKLLKLNPSTLRTKMRKLGIPFGRKVNV
ncbi:MAG: sigma 54-interacting transcriptional regulator [Pseudomonadota bacterium]